jgi:hypothetical protein
MTHRSLVIGIILGGALICTSGVRGDDNSADAAIASGLAYLARQQNADGSFEFTGRRVSSTAMSVLAFLSTGNTADGGRYAATVRRGTDFLLRQAPANHDFGKLDGSQVRGQAVVTLTLCQAYGVEPDEQTRAKIRATAKDAVSVLLASQKEITDPITTRCCCEALRAAQQISLHIPKENLDRAEALLTQHPPSTAPSTERLLKSQLPDGSWPDDASNQPASDVETTATNILTLSRSLHLMP